VKKSFTIAARKLPSGKFEGRLIVDRKHRATATFTQQHDLELWLDEKWEQVLADQHK
jgi:uncharacterized protein (DUF3820 family)